MKDIISLVKEIIVWYNMNVERVGNYDMKNKSKNKMKNELRNEQIMR